MSLERFKLSLSSASGLCLLPVGLQRHELFSELNFQSDSIFAIFSSPVISLPESSPVISAWDDSNPLERDLNKFASTHSKELSIFFNTSRHLCLLGFQVVTDRLNHQRMFQHLLARQNLDRFRHLLHEKNRDSRKQGKQGMQK